MLTEGTRESEERVQAMFVSKVNRILFCFEFLALTLIIFQSEASAVSCKTGSGSECRVECSEGTASAVCSTLSKKCSCKCSAKKSIKTDVIESIVYVSGVREEDIIKHLAQADFSFDSPFKIKHLGIIVNIGD
jgi:hypothetical protein